MKGYGATRTVISFNVKSILEEETGWGMPSFEQFICLKLLSEKKN
jgi:hypothetical protein